LSAVFARLRPTLKAIGDGDEDVDFCLEGYDGLDQNKTVTEAGLDVASVLNVRPALAKNVGLPCLNLYFQENGVKGKTKVSLGKQDPLMLAMQSFAQVKGVSVSTLVFTVDGHEVHSATTAEEQDLEDGDLIDVCAR